MVMFDRLCLRQATLLRRGCAGQAGGSDKRAARDVGLTFIGRANCGPDASADRASLRPVLPPEGARPGKPGPAIILAGGSKPRHSKKGEEKANPASGIRNHSKSLKTLGSDPF